MTAIAHEVVARLDDHYRSIVNLTPDANRLLIDLSFAEPICNEYRSNGFVKVPNILPADALIDLLTDLLPVLSVIAEDVTMRHTPTAQHTLSDAARFRRIDPYCVRDPGRRETVNQLLDVLGLTEFGLRLGIRLTPLVRCIVGDVTFQRVYFYLYSEGDYISVHDDHHVGDRVDVQFPVSFGTSGGVRVLFDGFLRMHYDSAGSMNVLGPNVWHDVPPLMRGTSGLEPLRVNIGLRFTFDPQSAAEA
jgi:hypothetical protein